MARRLGDDVVEWMVRGYLPGRSAEISMVARPWNVIVRWDGSTLEEGVRDPRTTHASPWSYHQRVPIILYGPGFIRTGVKSDRIADVADLAPTFARLMGFPFDAADGKVLTDALRPRLRRSDPPRLIVLVAYDGGGWNLLERYPDAWPVVRRLAGRGTTFVNATVGSTPSVTASIHATMGTGAYPRVHGVPEHAIRLPDGTVGDVYGGERADPRLLETPTLADAWDAAEGNRPWTGIVATEPWHLGMLGKGSLAQGGDRDVAVLWQRDEKRFLTNPDAFALPDYLPEREALDRHLRDLDSLDGALDNVWMGNDLTNPRVVLGSPAFVRHEGDALRALVRGEGLGRDALTDLLFVEFKSTDLGAHIWNLVGPEEPHVLRAQDEVMGDLVRVLNQTVGRGRYVLALTADHGLTPIPETMEGVRVHPDVVGERVNDYFGRTLVERVTPSSIYLDMEAVRAAGVTVAEIARYVGGLSYRDVLPQDAEQDAVPPQILDRQVFGGVLPGSFLGSLTEAEIAALGNGAFSEGDLTSPDHPYAGVL